MAKKERRFRPTLAAYEGVVATLTVESEARIGLDRRVILATEAAAREVVYQRDLEQRLIRANGLLTAALQVLQRPSLLANEIWLHLNFNPERLEQSAVQLALAPEAEVSWSVAAK